jgi:hypothetical protein
MKRLFIVNVLFLLIVLVGLTGLASAQTVTVTKTPLQVKETSVIFSGAEHKASAYILPGEGLQDTRERIRSEIGSKAIELHQLMRIDLTLLQELGPTPQKADFDKYVMLFNNILADISQAQNGTHSIGALNAISMATDAMNLAKSIFADYNFEQAIPIFVIYDATTGFSVRTVTKDGKLAVGPENTVITPLKWGKETYYNLFFLRGTSRNQAPTAKVVFGVRNLTKSAASGSFFGGPTITIDGQVGHFYVATPQTPPTNSEKYLEKILRGETFKLKQSTIKNLFGEDNK